MVANDVVPEKTEGTNRTVAYFYDTDIGSYYYGPGHPMKPQRIRMTHSLVQAYNLYNLMNVYRPHDATEAELVSFHDSEYIRFLSEVDPDNYKTFGSRLRRFNVGDATDCPVFDGLYEFQQSCAGASIDAAAQLNLKNCDIAINWSGGLHHAKRSEASGFCYINDIVLGILELLKYHTRVMYIDIDIHHGDGVEEAFYLTHRVMTVSFHKFGDFFPGTGDVSDVGAGHGKYYAVNVPLDDGVTDADFVSLYKIIVPKAVEVFKPGAIVLQCGADSVTGDRLGLFNLTIKGHAACVEFTKQLNIPLLILGGGGYTIRNVARTWLYETARLVDRDVSNVVPDNDYQEYFSPNYQLHLEPNAALANKNSPQYIEALQNRILKNLASLEAVPSVQFASVPPDFFRRDLPSHDLDDMQAQLVEWEGGGLAAGVDVEKLLSGKVVRPWQLASVSKDNDQDLRRSEDRLLQNSHMATTIDPDVVAADVVVEQSRGRTRNSRSKPRPAS